MPTELKILVWSAALLIVQVLLQSGLSTLELGPRYSFSARDDERKPAGLVARRADRALRNLLETYPAFVVLALGLVLAGKTAGLGLAGAHLWFWARLAYLPLYLAGIPVARTIVWGISLIGLVLMIVTLLR